MFNFGEIITEEEKTVINAIVTKSIHMIENGDIKRINSLLNQNRLKKMK